jgi:glycosyltransferase involved in cell wall biosynthesis
MNTGQKATSHYVRPDVSFVMPCYNEEEIIGYTIPKFIAAFKGAGHRLELIAVDNGSTDRTGELIKKWAARSGSVTYHRVEKNEGYGHGILSGFPLCSAPWVGIIPADGQVDAEDVVRLYESVAVTNGMVVGKVRRRFRMDGPLRKVVSVTYNMFVRLLWPRLQSIDINGNPKLLPREILLAMNLKSKGWFLDPEIMIKAHYMGLRVLEFNVFARMRGNGVSHVRPAACWEFFRNLITFRFSREMSLWRQDHRKVALKTETPHVAA